MSDVTQILSRIDHGDPSAAEQLLPLVYGELRALAAAKLARERPGQTLQATALVHEAFLRLVRDSGSKEWSGREHFFAAAAEAMRRILVDEARKRRAKKRGGDLKKLQLNQLPVHHPDPDERILLVDELLERLEQEHYRKAQVVKLRYFARFSIPETAEILGVSTSTIDNDWAYAKAWLKLAIQEASDEEAVS